MTRAADADRPRVTERTVCDPGGMVWVETLDEDGCVMSARPWTHADEDGDDL